MSFLKECILFVLRLIAFLLLTFLGLIVAFLFSFFVLSFLGGLFLNLGESINRNLGIIAIITTAVLFISAIIWLDKESKKEAGVEKERKGFLKVSFGVINLLARVLYKIKDLIINLVCLVLGLGYGLTLLGLAIAPILALLFGRFELFLMLPVSIATWFVLWTKFIKG